MYLLIVSGLSGSGKSTALKTLETMGYYCVDNLPSSMLRSFQQLCEQANPPIERAAVTIDGRESLLNTGFLNAIQAIDSLSCSREVLFMDARDEVLMERYNEHRKRHPLGEDGDALSGVRTERAYLQDMRERADYIFDTSQTSVREFPNLLKQLLPEAPSAATTIIIGSFGYKRGVPADADIVYDMRFLDNPYYVQELKYLSGLDAPVAQFLEKQPYLNTFITNTVDFIITALPMYQQQQKSILRICFGCTGGRHRSVYAADRCASILRSSGMPVRVFHRDLHIELTDIKNKNYQE